MNGEPKSSIAPYLGLISATAAFTFLIIRVLAVARLDATTALGIVAEGGTAALVAGTIAAAYGFLPAFGLVVLPYLRTSGRVTQLQTRVGAVVFAALIVILAPLQAGIAVLLGVAAAIGLIVTHRRKRPLIRDETDRYKSSGQIVDRLMLMLAIPTFLLYVVTAQPWLPAERVGAPGKPAVNGYVLKSSAESTAVLMDNPRQLTRFEGKVSRTFCLTKAEEWWAKSALNHAFSDAKYPLCKNLP